MPAHILYGDSFLVAQALRDIQAKVGVPEVLEANSHRVSGAQVDMGQLRALCSAVPFLAEHRLVIVEGLLSLFNSRDRRRRSSPAASRSSSTNWEDLPGYISNEMSPTTLLVFVEAELSKGNSLLEKLRPTAQIQALPTPSGEGLARWVRNRVAEKNAQITPGAIRLLSQMVGGNLWTMENELEKLALYVGDRAIEEKDVGSLVSQAREASIFSAVDALLEGRTAVSLQLVHRLRDDGVEFPTIVSMIARQLRLVTLARDLIDRGHGEKDIGGRLGLTHDFIVRKTLEQARRHSWGSLKWLYGRLMEADLAVKRGRLDQDVALEILIGEASGLTARRGQRPRQPSVPSSPSSGPP